MSIIKTQFILTAESYAERAQLVRDLQNECVRSEQGEKVDLSQTAAKLVGLMNALDKDLIAMGKTKVSPELKNVVQAHKKELNGLAAKVNALSTKANRIPAWAKPAMVGSVVVGSLTGSILSLAAATRRTVLFPSSAPSPSPAPGPGPSPSPAPGPGPSPNSDDKSKTNRNENSKENLTSYAPFSFTTCYLIGSVAAVAFILYGVYKDCSGPNRFKVAGDR